MFINYSFYLFPAFLTHEGKKNAKMKENKQKKQKKIEKLFSHLLGS